MKNKEQSHKRRNVKRILFIAAVALVLVVAGAGIMFRDELRIISSIRKIADDKPIYYMTVDGDYHFEDFLQSGGASSDKAVSAFLTKRISQGFYSIDVQENELACSTISANTPDGTHIWGRNFDWTGSVPIIVQCNPKNGYASISTCDFQNITSSPSVVPEGIAYKMLAIAALYVPMDGINEAGLCVADLEVNEGGMKAINTEKPDLTITTAIRLLLNKAATADEAIALLKQYDIHASAGISHHLSISDAAGSSVSVEFVDGEIVVVNTNAVTNFNLANGNTAAGGESAKQRFEYLSSLCQENKGILTGEQVKQALAQVSQSGETCKTQWSIVYDQKAMSAGYYFDSDFEKNYSFSLPKQ